MVMKARIQLKSAVFGTARLELQQNREKNLTPFGLLFKDVPRVKVNGKRLQSDSSALSKSTILSDFADTTIFCISSAIVLCNSCVSTLFLINSRRGHLQIIIAKVLVHFNTITQTADGSDTTPLLR